MKIIDFPKGLTFHTQSKESEFYKELKRILNLSRVTYADPCCPSETPYTPARYNTDTGVMEFYNSTTGLYEAVAASGGTAYKSYVASFSAVGNASPTPIVLENSLAGTLTFGTYGGGLYYITNSLPEFGLGKLWIGGMPTSAGDQKPMLIPIMNYAGNIAGYFMIAHVGDTEINLGFRTTGMAAVTLETILGPGSSYNLPEIRVYP